MYEGNELMELKDVTGFDHSLVFDENGHTDTDIVQKAQQLTGNAISIASYMRSHRIGVYSFSNTTTIYLKTTYTEKW